MTFGSLAQLKPWRNGPNEQSRWPLRIAWRANTPTPWIVEGRSSMSKFNDERQ
jgi:hypothetical protein